MSGPDKKGRDPVSDPSTLAVAAGARAEPVSEPSSPNGAAVRASNVPRWRQIEIMKERRALREWLGEDDDLDLDEDIFGDEDARKGYFQPAGAEEEEPDIDMDDDDVDPLDDDDFYEE